MDQRELSLNEFTKMICNHLKYNPSYSFRTVNIDGVLCYPVIHKHRKIVNFECVNIYCNVKNKWGDNMKEKYSVYYKKYVNIRDAILTVENVSKSFKMYNGDLHSPEDYKNAKMEEIFLPYNESQVCCVCYENTLDTTVCDHYLCLRCREVCLKKCVNDCPMCRNPGIVNIYNIENGLINNSVYSVLREVLDFERKSESDIEDETVFVSSQSNRIYSFIDRQGSGRRRTASSENIEVARPIEFMAADIREPSIDALSEVSTLDENGAMEDSSDLIPFDLSALFDAAEQPTI